MKLRWVTALKIAVFGFISYVLVDNYYQTKRRDRYLDARKKQLLFHLRNVATDPRGVYLDYSRLIEDKTQYQQFMSLITSNLSLESVTYEIDITLTYPPFSVPLPKFVNSSHRDVFINTPNHKQYIDPPSRDRLVGRILIIPRGMAHSQTGCGFNEPAVLRFKSARKDCPFRSSSYVEYACPLLYMEGGFFQHFLDGNLPKIVQVLPFLVSNPAIVLVNPRMRDDIVGEILNKLPIRYNAVHEFDARRCITSKLQINTCVTPPMHPLLWASARTLMGVTDNRKSAKVMLVTRVESRNGGREIINQEDVIKLLTERYRNNFQIFPGPLSLDDSLQVYGHVRVIIGVHGGGLYNLMFMSKHATVVEIVPRLLPDSQGVRPEVCWPPIFWVMASIIGQTYFRLYEDAIDAAEQHVTVNIDTLARVLDGIDHNS